MVDAGLSARCGQEGMDGARWGRRPARSIACLSSMLDPGDGERKEGESARWPMPRPRPVPTVDDDRSTRTSPVANASAAGRSDRRRGDRSRSGATRGQRGASARPPNFDARVARIDEIDEIDEQELAVASLEQLVLRPAPLSGRVRPRPGVPPSRLAPLPSLPVSRLNLRPPVATVETQAAPNPKNEPRWPPTRRDDPNRRRPPAGTWGAPIAPRAPLFSPRLPAKPPPTRHDDPKRRRRPPRRTNPVSGPNQRPRVSIG